MNHRALSLSLSRPSFGWGAPPVRGVFALILGVALGAGVGRAAENAGLAFVLGPGSHVVVGAEEVALPEGARIELLVDGTKEAGRFPVQVNPGGFVLPELALGKDGQRIRVRIAELATGWLTPGANGLALDLAVTVQVELNDGVEATSGAYTLALTTGAVAAANAAAATESGEAIDAASHSARFVAAGTVSADSPVAPGEPFLVVLEGTFEGLPADLR